VPRSQARGCARRPGSHRSFASMGARLRR
jgi:hypothetical protein